MGPERIRNVALIGFGEAAMAFVEAMGRARPALRAYDIKTVAPESCAAKRADYHRAGVDGCDTPGAAIREAELVLSLVTADQALSAAKQACLAIGRGAIFCDMNSIAPETKRTSAALIEQAGGYYADVALMAPVHPARLAVPLLVSGPHAGATAAALRGIGFTKVKTVDGEIGVASAIKMIRSVMVKGMEALSAECFLAAHAAGVTDAVIASLDASWPGADWRRRADDNIDRMMVHGLRRAAEMEEAAKMLDALGTGSAMTRGTIERQRAIGERRLPPVEGIAAKSALILDRKAGAE